MRRGYTDLEKETIGLEVVRCVMGGSATEIVDLLAQHGVGADAADHLRRFYELKVAASAEPDEIVLKDSQIRRTLSTKDFFLVIAAGVEGAPATPRTPVIVNPVGHLWMSERSQVRFGGIRQPRTSVPARTPSPTTARCPAADRRPPVRGQRGSTCAWGFGWRESHQSAAAAHPATRAPAAARRTGWAPSPSARANSARTFTVPKTAGSATPSHHHPSRGK